MHFDKMIDNIFMLRTFLGFGYLIFALLLLFPFAVIAVFLSLFGLWKFMKMLIYRLAQAWAISLIPIMGGDVKVSGRENIPKKGGVCFVSNHCGFFDIVLLLAYCGRPFGFIAKKELMYIPFMNFWIFMLGGLFIDRKNIRKAVRTINKGVKRIKAGGGMIIFPEGTRSKGRGLLPFHPGSLKLATQAEAVIVPVAIEGSYEVYEKYKRVITTPVKMAFLEPIDTIKIPQEEKKQVLSDNIYELINARLESFKN